jgi:hypothetical protein
VVAEVATLAVTALAIGISLWFLNGLPFTWFSRRWWSREMDRIMPRKKAVEKTPEKEFELVERKDTFDL